jgi:hypothetical protein
MVVGEFVCKSVSSDGVGVDDGGTSSSSHGPDAAFRVQDGEIERGTSGSIELLDVSFLLGKITAKRSGPNLVNTI